MKITNRGPYAVYLGTDYDGIHVTLAKLEPGESWTDLVEDIQVHATDGPTEVEVKPEPRIHPLYPRDYAP